MTTPTTTDEMARAEIERRRHPGCPGLPDCEWLTGRLPHNGPWLRDHAGYHRDNGNTRKARTGEPRRHAALSEAWRASVDAEGEARAAYAKAGDAHDEARAGHAKAGDAHDEARAGLLAASDAHAEARDAHAHASDAHDEARAALCAASDEAREARAALACGYHASAMERYRADDARQAEQRSMEDAYRAGRDGVAAEHATALAVAQ